MRNPMGGKLESGNGTMRWVRTETMVRMWVGGWETSKRGPMVVMTITSRPASRYRQSMRALETVRMVPTVRAGQAGGSAVQVGRWKWATVTQRRRSTVRWVAEHGTENFRWSCLGRMVGLSRLGRMAGLGRPWQMDLDHLLECHHQLMNSWQPGVVLSTVLPTQFEYVSRQTWRNFMRWRNKDKDGGIHLSFHHWLRSSNNHILSAQVRLFLIRHINQIFRYGYKSLNRVKARKIGRLWLWLTLPLSLELSLQFINVGLHTRPLICGPWSTIITSQIS